MLLRVIFAVLAAGGLASCMTDAQVVARNAQDERQCLSYGAALGSDAYVNCRSQLAAAHTNADAAEEAAGTVALSNVRPPSSRY